MTRQGHLFEKGHLFERSDPSAESSADARAEADVAAGRLVSHEAVTKWLRSWIDGKPIPRPRAGD